MGQMNTQGIPQGALSALTRKQRAVLDLLVQHKTSKEIARLLDISPYTVDQRIAAARKKFGADTRNELAAAYMQATEGSSAPKLYQESVYQSSQVATDENHGESKPGFDTIADHENGKSGADKPYNINLPVAYHRVVPESFEGRYGYLWRLAAIVGITLMFLIAILAGFAIFGQLSEMLR